MIFFSLGVQLYHPTKMTMWVCLLAISVLRPARWWGGNLKIKNIFTVIPSASITVHFSSVRQIQTQFTFEETSPCSDGYRSTLYTTICDCEEGNFFSPW